MKEHHGLFETYLSKLEKARKREITGFMVSSIRGTTDNIVRKKWLNDLVIMELNFRLFKLETIIQDYLREDELRLCLEGEEIIRCEHQKLIVEENMVRLDEAKRLRLEEENMLQLEQQKKNKQKEFMNSSHCKNLLSKLAHAKRIQLCSSSKKIKHKDTSRVLQSIETVWLSDDIERFLGQSGQIKCKFPWNDDYIADRNFWLKLVCLDPARKGWLIEEGTHMTMTIANGMFGLGIVYRLAYGLSLNVDDPVDVTLAYRKKMKPSTSSMDNSKRINDSTENYSLFKVKYDGMFDERPLRKEENVLLFKGRICMRIFLHADCVNDHFDVLDNWSYEDVYGGGCFDVCGSFKGFDCIEEPVGCVDGSLPGKIKDEFLNEVILDDVVSSPATLSMLLKRKGKSRVKSTRMRRIIKRSKMVSLRMWVRSNY
nr:phospholipase-like protein [Tanacetum cinerariifolium]